MTPEESLKRISVPSGFHKSLYAAEPNIRRPIAFDFDDRGRLWVVENYSHPKWNENNATDRIVILEDEDNDGTFDSRTVFYDRGRYLTGIAVGHGGVWIANTPELSFIPDRDHDDKPDSEPVAILDGFHISTNNVLNNFHWGPDGWLYGAIGLSSPSHIGIPGTPKEKRVKITRGIWRVHPETHLFEKVAEGMVNPWGADFNEYGDLITANTVIAHLWHIVPGMYCERRAAERDNPYAYDRIQTIANHLHWGGGGWQSSRAPANKKSHQKKSDQHEADEEYHQHSVAGGGHAHCGAMIYLGDNWPDKYRGTFFTNNLHGSRVNNDKLIPKRSTYVGEHSDDLIFANDPWFRGMSIKCGPDGGVYISDWHDFGECHDADGSHRSSGRIYKFVYGSPEKPETDLQRRTSLELANLHLHRNEWFVRHARRILHERSLAGDDLREASERLVELFSDESYELNRLRALWTLYCIDALDREDLSKLLADQSEHVRRWGVRFLVDHFPTDTSPNSKHRGRLEAAILNRLIEMAKHDPSAKVRLELACSLQRLPHNSRLRLATALASHAEDATDPYLPLMIWYGLEPAVVENAEEALQLAESSQIPLLRQYVARRMCDQSTPAVQQVLTTTLAQQQEEARLDFLVGMFQALEGKGAHTPPPIWSELYAEIRSATDPKLRSTGISLAIIFGDKQAIKNLQRVVADASVAVNDRREALASLLKLEDAAPVAMLHHLIRESSPIRSDAIRALAIKNAGETVQVLLEQYPSLTEPERQQACGVLATRLTFAHALLDSIAQGDVSRDDVTAYTLQQLRAFNVNELQAKIDELWADDKSTLLKSDEIAKYLELMSPEYLNQGDVREGRLVFEKTCAKCHTLFGEGGDIAPDLTGSGRKNPDYVLRNLIDPSAEIDAAYRLTTVLTSDGRLFNGFIVHQDDRWVEIRTQDAQIRLSMNDVEELVVSNSSMMPEGMLRAFTEEQIRDLLVYLASDDQVPLPTDSN